MPSVQSKALNKSIDIEREIGKLKGHSDGPTIVFTGGIHGNEPSGVFALHQVFSELKAKNVAINGCVIGLSGNLSALSKGIRYAEQDLNRLWKGGHMRQIEYGEAKASNQDIQEQIEIYDYLQEAMSKENGPYYFMDLHTTSSDTIPFLTVNDSLLNRKFTKQYPVPIILGIEEHLDGPLLSYVNKLGYVAFGYEAGQHDDISSIENHVAFIYLTLVFAGVIKKEDIDYNHYHGTLAKYALGKRSFYEIFHHHKIKEDEDFEMNAGFVNFQAVEADQELATSDGYSVRAERDSMVFMPLYQKQGSDGFFLLKSISPFFLNLSALVRKMKFDRILVLLPGVKWTSIEKHAMLVNRNVARLFTKHIFHLLGYRSRELNEDKYFMRNRETRARTKEYKNAPWF